MVRPRRFRRIFQEPEIRCFKPDSEGNIDSIKPVDITIDEFEAIRLKDYQNIKQKKAAEIMDVSQPTFHRTLNSARGKIAKALVEGKIIKIKGGDYVTDKKRYRCKSCGFEWYSPEKEYKKCPDCGSEDIHTIAFGEETQRPVGQPGLGRRRGYGGGGIGAGPPRVCKCPNCGYESEKTPGIPCRNTKCPECGTQLCGAD
jgi:predicted DNA-binding protein (UPF0251 family)